jgi:hypothetical protein
VKITEPVQMSIWCMTEKTWHQEIELFSRFELFGANMVLWDDVLMCYLCGEIGPRI